MSLFSVIMAAPDSALRNEVRERFGEELASDACAVVTVQANILGWCDDYGTFHALPGATIGLKAISAIEDLMQVIGEEIPV